MRDSGNPVQIHAIAQRQQIPEDYLRQLLGNLRTAGLVRSVRGPHGGYLLAKKAEEISMAEVLGVLEGPPDEMSYSESEISSVLGGEQIRDRWAQAIEQMQLVLEQTTIEDLVASKFGESTGVVGQPTSAD
tara:strand:+ start:168 stop:560 length:393 start_codon:yes stop_codon:yes gene_type:complete